MSLEKAVQKSLLLQTKAQFLWFPISWTWSSKSHSWLSTKAQTLWGPDLQHQLHVVVPETKNLVKRRTNWASSNVSSDDDQVNTKRQTFPRRLTQTRYSKKWRLLRYRIKRLRTGIERRRLMVQLLVNTFSTCVRILSHCPWGRFYDMSQYRRVGLRLEKIPSAWVWVKFDSKF